MANYTTDKQKQKNLAGHSNEQPSPMFHVIFIIFLN